MDNLIVEKDELECIEGDNDASSHIFNVNDLAGLRQLQKDVIDYLIQNRKICKNI